MPLCLQLYFGFSYTTQYYVQITSAPGCEKDICPLWWGSGRGRKGTDPRKYIENVRRELELKRQQVGQEFRQMRGKSILH